MKQRKNHWSNRQPIEAVTESGCWIWTAAMNAKGYGICGEGLVHRVMYEKFVGPIQTGKYVLHKCDVRCCCNPSHLYVGNQKDNMRDMFERGRTGNRKGQPAGEKHSLAKLSEESVVSMRTMYSNGIPLQELALTFGVSNSQARRIVNRQRWTHI